jgi:hypothetical protein
MGGDLESAPEGKAPTFMIRALRDPDGANLDRIQVIKGWSTQDGEPKQPLACAVQPKTVAEPDLKGAWSSKW